MEDAIKQFFPEVDKATSIARSTCVNPPVGCGGQADVFKDLVSAQEYQISGLCQKCQDNIEELIQEEDQAFVKLVNIEFASDIDTNLMTWLPDDLLQEFLDEIEESIAGLRHDSALFHYLLCSKIFQYSNSKELPAQPRSLSINDVIWIYLDDIEEPMKYQCKPMGFKPML